MRKPAVLIAFVCVVSFALGGVAFGSHDFPDVPDSHPFHDDISWLASTGITEGFADGNYKPGQAVTRQSMAAFMRRLAGADPDVEPMVDAALLDDRTPADYDNAVTLNGRTPADYDDADTVDGESAGSFARAITLGSAGPAVPINGISSGTASLVTSVGSQPTLDRLVLFEGLLDTSYDSVTVSCMHDGVPVRGMTDINIGDNAVGYTDRVFVSAWYVVKFFDAGELRCWKESPVGTGALEFEEYSDMEIRITDFSS